MTDFRIRRLVFAALTVPLLGSVAFAQWSSDKPPVLEPDDYPPVSDDTDRPPLPTQDEAQPTQAPQSSGDRATTGPRQLGTAPVDQPTQLPAVGPAVEVGSLGTAEGPPAGTLNSSNGGLGDSIWSGSDRATVETLLQSAPLASPDPALRSLVKRALLTTAGAPPGSSKHAFATTRIRKLLRAGMVEEAGTIAAQSTVNGDSEFALTQATALLFADRASDVCGDATSTRLTAGEAFWLELRAYCAAVSGDQATADLTRQVLVAQGGDDPAFDTLYDDVINKQSTAPGPIAEPTALHVFLLQQAGLPIPPDVAQKLGPAADAVLLRDSKNSPQTRLAAVERLAKIGAVSLADLRTIADAQDIPLSRVANAANEAPTLPFIQGQMLLRRAATIEPRPDAKAAVVAQALALADKANMLPLAANLQSDLVAGVKPNRADSQARLFARALLLAGKPALAARWAAEGGVLQAAADLRSGDPARQARLTASLTAYATGLAKNPPDADPDRSYKALVVGIADALGQPLPPEAQAQSVAAQRWDGKRPEAGVMRTIAQAAQRPDRKGEAVLRIANAINGIGFRDMAPDVTIEFVRQLENMGMPDAAREVAFEALARYVPPPLPPAPTASSR